MERHEDAALAALITLAILGLVSLAGLLSFRKAPVFPRWFISTAVALATAAGLTLVWTALLGGQIRHSEIRSESKAAISNAAR